MAKKDWAEIHTTLEAAAPFQRGNGNLSARSSARTHL
jgi:hypothetical protein